MSGAYHRDGQTRFDGNNGRGPNYEPNSFGGAVDDVTMIEPPLRITGDTGRHNHRDGNDDYTRAGNLYRLVDADARTRLVENLIGAVMSVPQFIQERQVGHFYHADPEYGSRVAAGLSIKLSEIAGITQKVA